MKLGKITRITDLRSIWPHEANDFTKWLADEHNLAKLGEEIDIELELEERESSVSNSSQRVLTNKEPFSLDGSNPSGYHWYPINQN